MNVKQFNLLIFILSVGIASCIFMVAFAELTNKESALLGIVLTMLSFVSSWLVSRHFSDRSHKQAIEEVKEQHSSNLRTYALNAAEKVNNLSNELAKLSVYLQQELEEDGEDLSTEELYNSSYERIESAVHIVNTLKSVNDTYLSDWKGVIGEELNEKFEEQQERENELKELVQKVELILKNKPAEQAQSSVNDVQKLSKQINDIRRDLNLTLNSVSGTFVRPARHFSTIKKEVVFKNCPNCNFEIKYKQRPKGSSFKLITCENCSAKLNAIWREEQGFLLEPERLISETYDCPSCNFSIVTDLTSRPHGKAVTACSNCGTQSQISRTVDGEYSIQQISKATGVEIENKAAGDHQE